MGALRKIQIHLTFFGKRMSVDGRGLGRACRSAGGRVVARRVGDGWTGGRVKWFKLNKQFEHLDVWWREGGLLS